MKVTAQIQFYRFTTPDTVKFDSLKEFKAYFANQTEEAWRYHGLEISQKDPVPNASIFIGDDVGDYPDYIASIGPRMGVRVERT